MKPTAFLLALLLATAAPLAAQNQENDAADEEAAIEGNLTPAEIQGLVEKARLRLKRTMARLDERERRNNLEADADERAEQDREIKYARYRASLLGLELDLLYRIARLRGPGGDRFEDALDGVQDKVKDTFADLHDKIDDEAQATWAQTLDTGRKYHTQFGKDIDLWAGKIGVSADVPNALEIVTARKEALIARLDRLRRIGHEKYEDGLDALEERIYESFENIEEKIEESPHESWPGLVKDARKFEAAYTAELDGWAREIGVDESLPSPIKRLAELKEDLVDQIRNIRRIGDEEHEDVIDEIAGRVDDIFADLKDKLDESERAAHPDILETATKYHEQFSEILELWERRIVGAADRIDRDSHEPGGASGVVEDYPESDVELPRGEHMDVVGGVRISRLLPLLRRQLNLDHGLSVNEIVDADGVMARAGVEVYDIILKVNGEEMDTRMDVRNAVSGVEEGSEINVEVLRDGERKTLKATR